MKAGFGKSGSFYEILVILTVLTFALLAFGCGGSGSSGDSDPIDEDDTPVDAASVSVSGAGVKGPLAGAVVNLYEVDLSADDLKGSLLGEGSTGSNAAIDGLEIDEGLSGLLLLEFLVNDDTVEVNTGEAPVFDKLITVCDVQRIYDGDAIYASPLTTMAVSLAQKKADTGSPFAGNGDDVISESEFISALEVAQNQVKSTLGFGLDSMVDIFTVPPMLTSETDTTQEQTDVAAYRQAIEALTAIVDQVAIDSAADDSAQDIIDALVEDLSDGVIDGESEDGPIDALTGLDDDIDTILTTVDLTTLLIPGTDRPVSDVELELVDEMAATGEEVDTDALEGDAIEVDLQQPETVVDSDGDGMDDLNDDFPSDPTEWLDSDGDGVGDNSDDFPLDPTEWLDSDNDGVGDNSDAFPNDSTEWLDSDADGVGNNSDAFPNDSTEWLDSDNDGVGDNSDAFPTDPTRHDPEYSMGGAIQGTALSLTGSVSTISGSPDAYGNSDGAPYAPLASFNFPSGMTFVGDDAYVVDTLNSTIRKISTTSQQVTTFAGQAGSYGDADGIGSNATFLFPRGITNDGTYLYVADSANNRIRRIDIATAEVDTLAGDGTLARVDSSNGYGDTASFVQPWALVFDNGYLYVVEHSGQTIRKVDAATGETTTLAGDGTDGSSDSTDHTGATASFSYPRGITSDGSYLYVSDFGNNTIRRVDMVTGETTTLAGTAGVSGVADGTGLSATFNCPAGITTDGTYLYVAAGGAAAETMSIRRIEIATAVVTTVCENLQGGEFLAIHDNALYIDDFDYRIARVDMDSWASGTFAGSDATGSNDGPLKVATYSGLSGVTTDGTSLYMSDDYSHLIRKIDLTTGLAATVAGQAGVAGADDGTGTDATFYRPADITTDGIYLYVADTFNHAIRQIDIATGEVTTLAGGSGGYLDDTGTAAKFNRPTGVTTDGSYLYVADYYNLRIRRIDIATGVVDTFAGSGDIATTDGTGTAAAFYLPYAITADGTYLYVTESMGCVIRRIEIASRVVTTLAGDGTCADIDGTGTGASFYMSTTTGTGLTTDGTTLYVGNANGVRSVRLSDAEVTTLTTESPTAYGVTTDGTSLYATDSANYVVHKIE